MLKTLTPPDETAIEEGNFRRALRRFASGVTVITSIDERGHPHGMTATAFCSLSLRPPLIMVAVAHGTRCHRLVSRQKRFGVNILSADQTQLARHFGGSPSSDTKPAFGLLNNVTVLEDAMVTLSCRLEDMPEGGDHSIFIGLVTGARARSGEPLLHFDGRYHSITPEELN